MFCPCNPSFALHVKGDIERLAGLLPGTEWLVFNEMHWRGDAGWLAAGHKMSDRFGRD